MRKIVHATIGLFALCLVQTNMVYAAKAGKAYKPEAGSDIEKDKSLNSKWQIEDDPSLPRVLLLGDSISIGYTFAVRSRLEGKANVHRALNARGVKENCQGTTFGLERLDAWLGDKPWDVIHFNWGLHDLKYVDAKGKKVKPNKGQQQATPEQYGKNLETLIQRLQQTQAKLIFATTIPFPEGSAGRVVGDEITYNTIAKQLMQKYAIEVVDTWALLRPNLAQYGKPQNVHLKPEGYALMADAIAAKIEATLSP